MRIVVVTIEIFDTNDLTSVPKLRDFIGCNSDYISKTITDNRASESFKSLDLNKSDAEWITA